MKTLEEVTQELDATKSRVEAAVTQMEAAAEAGDTSKVEEFKALLEGKDDEPGLIATVDTLKNAHDAAVREEEFKAMRGRLDTLDNVIADLRKGPKVGKPAGGAEGKSADDEPYGDLGAGERSIFADIRAANRGNADARARLTTGYDADTLTEEGKALTEGVNAQGGYLVRPQVERVIVETRELDNVLRRLVSKVNVTTNSIQLDQLTLSTTAGWVAELAQKPESTGLALASITAGVHTAAGLVTISNQLLQDSNPSVDGLTTADLAKRLVALEETAFLIGTGTNQPLGILNTPGLSTTTITDTGVTSDDGLLDKILDAIADVQTNHGQPTGILLHPRTWTRVLKDKDANGHYTIGTPTQSTFPDPTAPRTVNTSVVPLTLFGVPVYLSNRVPTNLGAGTNESRVIVADFREALILDRQGITVDESSHVNFTTNQTVFRAEERVGFTAARTPTAFNIIGGTGLANG